MDGVKSDDFSALLAALNSRSNQVNTSVPAPPQQFHPPQYMWQPVPIQPPVVAAPPVQKSGVNIWIVILLLIVAVAFCAIAWMRASAMKPEVVEEESEDEKEESKIEELPTPAQVSEYEESYDEDVVREFVSANILNFTKHHEVEVEEKDEEVFHIHEELPAEIKASSKRIVADESQEVIDYAKRREALFK